MPGRPLAHFMGESKTKAEEGSSCFLPDAAHLATPMRPFYGRKAKAKAKGEAAELRSRSRTQQLVVPAEEQHKVGIVHERVAVQVRGHARRRHDQLVVTGDEYLEVGIIDHAVVVQVSGAGGAFIAIENAVRIAIDADARFAAFGNDHPCLLVAEGGEGFQGGA